MLIAILVGALYGGVAVKFWLGFRQTHYQSSRLSLSLLWPVYIFNRSYRSNFFKALKG
jgi:hypothetical protein